MEFKPTPEQEKIFKFIKKRPENLLIEAYAGAGKCLGVNTLVLMYDGTTKKVQDVIPGDLLMGDDSKPRTILNTNTGYGDLYKVIPQKGEPWVCNDVHVLTHHHEQKKKLIDLPLNEINYPKYPNGNFRYARIQRTSVNFNKQNVNIDPYLLGLWLGDGSKNNGNPVLTINKFDNEIINYLKNIQYHNITTKISLDSENCYRIALTIPNHSGKGVKNILKEEFKRCYFNGDIGIPHNYLINSKENRLRLLAGLLDSDGYLCNKYFEIVTKYNKLAEDILFLSRSLGFAAYKKKKIGRIKSLNFSSEYWRITIAGSFENVPFLREKHVCEKRKQIKSVLRTGFKTEYIGKSDYYGFTLDGNGRFLLGDFTITHNTSTLVEIMKLLPKDANILFLAFNKHIQEELKAKLPDHVRCYTSHGLGMSAIKRKYGDKIEFDEFKIDKIIKKESIKWDLHGDFDKMDQVSRYLNSMKKMVNLCRLSLTLDKKYIPFMADRYDVKIDKNRDVKRIIKLLDIATKDRKFFDYTDMVYLPAVDKSLWLFPQDYVIVDECLPYDTYITTIRGKFKIGKLLEKKENNQQLPDAISFNETTKLFEYKPIEDVWCTGEKDVYCVTLNHRRKLKSTVNHKFLTTNGWTRLDDLKLGDVVLGNNDKTYTVTEEMEFLKKEKTYDMTVKDNHNFITSNAYDFNIPGIITHNCQDINRSQQRLIEKSIKKDKVSKKFKGRLIAVGDGFQSIYGFNSITDRTFLWFKERPNTKTLPLSYSFRCAKNIIAHANEIVPEIKALPEAPEGVVRDGNVLDEATDGDFVLCRTTMPLVQLFFQLLSQHKKAVIKGSDIGLDLINLIGDNKNVLSLKKHWKDELVKFQNKLKKEGILNYNEHSGYVAMEDKANTLIFLANYCNTIKELKEKIKTIFTDELSGIILSTVHKAKGLEANRVFIVRPDLMPLPNQRSWQQKQEMNLKYVAITRAKSELVYDREWTDEGL